MLLEFFRSSVQQWYFKHRNTAATVKTPLTPYAEHKIGKRVGKSLSWTVNPSTNMICEVVDRRKNGTVNLEARTCTCKQWQLSGLPCGHVAAVTRYFKMDNVTCFAERYFTTETYQAAYSEAINPTPHPSEWDDPGNLQICLPPILVKRQSGRPPGRARIPSKGEEKQKYKNHCSRCKEQGHSRVNCTAPYDRTDEPSRSRTTARSNSRSKSRSKSVSKKKTSTKATSSKVEEEGEPSQATQTFPSVHLSQP